MSDRTRYIRTLRFVLSGLVALFGIGISITTSFSHLLPREFAVALLTDLLRGACGCAAVMLLLRLLEDPLPFRKVEADMPAPQDPAS
jgi:hypothetical protein